MIKKSLIVLFLSLICINDVQATKILTEDELDKIFGAQMGLVGAGIDRQIQYAFGNGGKSPEGCIDFENNLHAYGAQISFQDIEFKCFKVQDRESNIGVFQSLKLVRFVRDFCQENKTNEDCTDIDYSLMQQLFEQL